MTKDSNKELTAEQKLINILAPVEGYYTKYDEIMQWHKSECKKWALECVPEKIDRVPKWEDAEEQLNNITIDAHNACREQMIKNIDSKGG